MAAPGRLPRGRDFDLAFSEGTVVGGPLLVARVRRRDAGEARWGFAVGKRLDKRAVVRNRIRRRLRSAAGEAGAAGSFDIVIVARPPALAVPYGALRDELRRLLERAGVLAAVGAR